jgi:UDP-N-acetylglucosamine--N-acetylmuramyl-(pentapeptide) pyrophosphoryl-undecaprenol N-acetylglucosamine transferase
LSKIILTGGGTAGHVSPNLALVPKLQELGWQVEYIGSHQGIERQLVEDQGIPYQAIASGKLRRYFDWQNFVDPFKVVKGVMDAYILLGRSQPDLVFSKGGFVTVPVILAAWMRGIPVIVHESDFTPGLSNKLSIPFASQVCVTFPETLQDLPQGICTGLPIRSQILQGEAARGRSLCKFQPDMPILLVIGGSLGSAKLNAAIREILPSLTCQFQVVHVCGQGNLDPQLRSQPHYCQFEYLKQELADVFAMSDLVVSRAGANAVFELLALRKPHLLVPLSKLASRGDQILNAKSFQQSGYSLVLLEESLNSVSLFEAIAQLYDQRQTYIDKMQETSTASSIEKIIQVIQQSLSKQQDSAP